MKFLKQGVCLALMGAGLAAVPGVQAVAAGSTPTASGRSLVQQMKDGADGSVSLAADRATGKVSFVRAGLNGDLLPGNSQGRANPAAKAGAYLDKYAPVFGARSNELVQDEVSKSVYGATVTYTQEYKGIPVFGSMLRAHLDETGALTALNGQLIPTGALSTATRLTADQAAARALTLVKAQPPLHDGGKADLTGLKAASSTLEVYRHGLVQGVKNGATELVYQVEVTNKKNIRDMVFVSATTGKVANRYSLVDDAMTRELYEADADRNLTKVWQEGDPLPGTLNADQESMVRSTGDAYWFFSNAFGRDSYDGAGAIMRTINNDPAIDCPNANWNGSTTNYCDGVSSDDVVAHEWGHAYTEYTHGLIYQWQSGALNEAYSDIWGETVDLINGRLDEGEGDLTQKRPVGQCSSHSPANPRLTINAPASIAKDCDTGGAAFGPQLSGTGVTGTVVMGLDADEDADNDPNPFDTGGSSYDGCSPFTNGADLVGKVVMVNRGLCGFETKARHIDAAGGVAAIIANRNEGEVFTMSGDADPDPSISSVMIDLVDRTSVADALAANQPVNVSMKDASGDRYDSYRWLMGEKSPAFGGAIRDMWSPTCYGDPGKVSDAQYVCSSDDNGGVHSNSGVVNHGYALLADGGSFNGVTVQGIGLDKAANIYFKAMTDYQTPVSDFVDHANSLESACADLTGHAINNLSTQPNSSSRAADKITSTDCAQVSLMTRAVELRKDPTAECAWQPLLKAGSPVLCGASSIETSVFSEDFESGLGDWTLTGANAFGGPTFDWATTRNYRGDHTGSVAFGDDPSGGTCAGDTGDISSVNYMTSQDIAIPAGDAAPRMSFEHYIGTEAGFDGGNVQLSINGGAFAPVDAAAYTFNGPGHLSTADEGSTNPLEGQDGFTGTNPGSPYGSWGESQVDLGAAGVVPGDTIALQFAMGRDGCGGVDGWYVDNVSVVTCAQKGTSHTHGTARPNPVHRTKTIRATITVAATGTTPTGRVMILSGGKRVGTGTLADGKVTIKITKNFPVGRRAFVARYLGSDSLSASRDWFRVRIIK